MKANIYIYIYRERERERGEIVILIKVILIVGNRENRMTVVRKGRKRE